jgi:hypothetical protein
MRRPRRRWRDPAPPPAGESRSPGSSPRYERPSRTRSPRRPAALHARTHHGALPLCIPALTTALSTALDRSPRRLPSLPHRCTRQSSTPSLASPSSQSKHASEPRPDSPQVQRKAPALDPNMDLPPRMQVLTTTLPHFPTVQRSSGPPPSAVPSGYGPPPGMADGGTRQQAQAGGIHPLEQVRSPLIALDCP